MPVESHGTMKIGVFDAAARARTHALFEALEFRSLLPRLDALPL